MRGCPTQTVVALLGLVAAACGGQEGGGSSSDSGSAQDTSDTATIDTAVGYDSSHDTFDSGTGFDTADAPLIIDGGTECDLAETSTPAVIQSCCNGAACEGDCYEVSPGHDECRCIDVVGGCSPPFVCCIFLGGCTMPDACTGGH